MSKQIINAKTRTTTGKTAAKNLRKEGCDLVNDEFILLAGDIYCKYLFLTYL